MKPLIYRSFTKYWRCMSDDYTHELHQILMNPDAYTGKPFLKYAPGEKTHVSLINLTSKQIVIKKYNIINFWHGFKLLFKKTRASLSWHSAIRLNSLNIPTPKPIAMIENRLGIFRRESYFIYEYIPGQHGLELFPNEVIAKQIINIIHALSFHKIIHGDLKASNFIFSNESAYIIDLDAMRFCKFNFSAKRGNMKDKKRFMENWEGKAHYHLFESQIAKTQRRKDAKKNKL